MKNHSVKDDLLVLDPWMISPCSLIRMQSARWTEDIVSGFINGRPMESFSKCSATMRLRNILDDT